MIRPLYGPDLGPDFFATLSALSDPTLSLEKAKEILLHRIKAGVRTFVYLLEDRVVGTASLFIERKFLHGGGKVGHIEDVAVHPDHQGKGVGSALVNHLTEIGVSEGCYKVICTTERVPFYERLGFVRHEIGMRYNICTGA